MTLKRVGQSSGLVDDGIALGLVSWVAIRALTGRIREVPILLGVLALLLGLWYGVSH